jgi:Sec-independent protein translocase protein TatA
MNNPPNPNLPESKTSDSSRNWYIKIVSGITFAYLIFSLISPFAFNLKSDNQPRKIEFTDLAIIALILIFNSNLPSRLVELGISTDGGITTKFKELNELKQEVTDQKKQIDDLQAQQLEQLEKQQKNLESVQAFTYSLLLGKKDREKIEQLEKNSQAKLRYDFNVPEIVGNQLRRLRDLNLIDTKSGYNISDIVKASDNGKNSIDLTEYLDVTELGRKFLITHEKLEISDRQIATSQE